MRFDRTFRRAGARLSLGVVTVVGGTAAAAFTATHPAEAAAALAAVQNAVTCSSTSACYLATNSSTGPGVAGTSTGGIGVQGKGPIGVKGIGSTNAGVLGQSTSGFGVLGSSASASGSGVAGTTTSGNGVYGSATNGGIGVRGSSTDGYALYGSTSTGNGIGVVGTVTGAGVGVYGSSATSYGVEALSTGGDALYAEALGGGNAAYVNATSGGYGLVAYSNGNVAVYASNTNGSGADLRGTYIGSISRAPTTGYPIVATDPSGNNLFYVDGSGNVSYHGGLFHFARVGAAVVKSFSPNTTAPTLEDTGTAQLVGGAAVVRLDPTFAASIDAASSYRVFVTPNGDTRGLFVATKTANGFIVRESQGGRSTVSFDYRIVATAAGQSGQRMAVANLSSTPHAIAPNAPKLAGAPGPAPAALPSVQGQP